MAAPRYVTVGTMPEPSPTPTPTPTPTPEVTSEPGEDNTETPSQGEEPSKPVLPKP